MPRCAYAHLVLDAHPHALLFFFFSQRDSCTSSSTRTRTSEMRKKKFYAFFKLSEYREGRQAMKATGGQETTTTANILANAHSRLLQKLV